LQIQGIYDSVFGMENMKNEENTENKDSIQVYEISFLLLPTLPEEKLASEVGLIKSAVEDNGGVFISEEFPKNRALSYPMSKVIQTKKQNFREGYFGWVKFELESESLPKIKKSLESNPHILRFLLIKTVKENTLFSTKLSTTKKASDEQKVSTDTDKASDAGVAAQTSSPEEIDKSIDALVIS
jgi:ribosomal protein S6